MNDYTKLSLIARLAVGLHCFANYCEFRGLRHPEVDRSLNHLWELPLVFGTDGFAEWETDRPQLIGVGLGDNLSAELRSALARVNVMPEEFRRVVVSLVEIIYSSFYGASQDRESLEYLRDAIAIAESRGVVPPPSGLFAQSRFVDEDGWGKPISVAKRDEWRLASW